MLRLILIACLSLFLAACATQTGSSTTSPRVASELAQGQRYFEQNYYKRAMRELLPLACDGNAQAQYAVGYMYYYGYGVAQDTEVGYFWIKRSADQHLAPAQHALEMIAREERHPIHAMDKLKRMD